MKPLCYLLAALAATPGFAQTIPAPLEPITVTASGRRVPVGEALAATIVISRPEIERAQAGDIAELLRFHAGVEVARNGGPGAVSSVFVRGAESNHTLLLVDGVRINPASSGGAALQNLTPAMIERIEIVKGPRATLYGSDAIGGVVNVITRAAAAPLAELRARGGAYRTRDGGAFLAAGDGISGIALDAQHLESDGFPPQPGPGLDRGHRNSTANLRAHTQLRGIELGMQLWNAQGNSEYTGFSGPADQDFRNQVLALHAATRLGNRWESRVSLSRMLDDVDQQQSPDFTRTVRSAVQWHNVADLGAGQHLSLGGQWAREEVTAELFGTPIGEDRELLNGFVQYEIEAGRQRALAAVGSSDHEAFGSQLNWNGEYGFDLRPETRLIAAAGTGFRAPDATDRFGFGGNPDLAPERARNFEAGLRQELGIGQSAELRLFRAEVDHLISVECVANCVDADPFNDTFRAVNVDRYRNRGAELSFRLERPSWSTRLSLIRQDPRSVARPDPCSGGARLCRRSDASAALNVVRRWQALTAGLDVLAANDRVDFGGERLPGYALFNLTGSFEWPRIWLGARVENLCDRDYQTAAGFRQAGRSAYVSLGWRL